MKLPPDWSEFIGLMCSRRVRFLVVGAHAVAANGRPRATQDLDIWVESTRANARRIGQVLTEFGFTELGRQVVEFATPDRMATLGTPPLRIDVMTSVTGVSFSEAWKGRVVTRFGEHEVGFLGRRELIMNKRASGRPKDLADIALLEEGREGAPTPRRRNPRS